MGVTLRLKMVSSIQGYTPRKGKGTKNMERYKDLMDAAKMIAAAKAEVNREDGPVTSPAWVMLHHAEGMMTKQAELAMREGA
jgi:isopenicillin N synthase-like dioxygenase